MQAGAKATLQRRKWIKFLECYKPQKNKTRVPKGHILINTHPDLGFFGFLKFNTRQNYTEQVTLNTTHYLRIKVQ